MLEDMNMKKLNYTSFFYLILGLVAGVFYREYTKMNNFLGTTVLSSVHSHILVLGFLFFLIVTILAYLFKLNEEKGFNAWYIVYNLGLLITIGTFVARGMLQVNGAYFKGLSHIAGTGHAILGIALVWFMFLLQKSLKVVALKASKAN